MEKSRGDLPAIRREYLAEGLSRTDLALSPTRQFSDWLEQAKVLRADDVSSMTLATADTCGMPSARIVLLKHYDEQGFCWYTDYESRKGSDLAQNPQAELLFYWYALERQVRIQGRVHKLSAEAGQQYFTARPRESQLSAAASCQSKPIASRQALQASVTELEKECQGDVPKPERWGGYCLVPSRFEFWQGREGRLHDRFVYQRTAQDWMVTRLQP